MFKRTFFSLIVLATLALLFAGCGGNDHDVKVEQHEEVNTQETVSSRVVVE